MTLDYGTAVLSAEKFRLMRKGNIVMLISMVALLLNAIWMLVWVLTQPISFYIRGGMDTVFVLILVSGIAVLVGNIMYLVGLYGLRQVQSEFRTAFACEIVLIAVGLVINLLGEESFLGQFLGAARDLGSCAVIWLVVRGVRSLLEGQNQEQVLRRGELLWKLELASTVLALCLEFFPTGGEVTPATITVLVVAVVLSVVAFGVLIYYVSYLGQVAKALDSVALRQTVEALEEE